MSNQVIILAAGQGKRMNSTLPKVLHLLAGKPILQHVIETAKKISDKKPIIVIGHHAEKLRATINHDALIFVEQKSNWGTGHALLQALPEVSDSDKILIYMVTCP